MSTAPTLRSGKFTSHGWLIVIVLSGSVPAHLLAQSTSTLTGTVVDSTGAVLPGTDITVISDATSIQRRAVTGGDGTFLVSALSPGRYKVKASLSSFVPLEMTDVVVNVDDRVEVRLEMTLATRGENVTVRADATRLNTSSSVSTVIDRQFVENLPLNGRSFQSLLELTPGVVLARAGTNNTEGGQFSVNGQRTSSNYFTIDGIGANAGISSARFILPGQSGSGSLPALTALGGTNGLVSVDALQEFRIQTSSYAPEFGRTPGGQVSLVTRSGTNRLHGTAFEYFRDDAMDANDWFQNRLGRPKPEMRQHNFGGVLGGALIQNRLFAFGSYEGLQLLQPRVKQITVPTLAFRQSLPATAQPYINAVPLPNGDELGGGLAYHNASYSDPSEIHSTSARVDHHSGSRFTTFARGSYAPTFTSSRIEALSFILRTHQNSKTFTTGSTWIVSNRLVHDVRANYSSNDAPTTLTPDTFGGAVPPDASVFAPGLTPDNAFFQFITNNVSWSWGTGTAFLQRQLNLVDSLTFSTHTHETKLGLDYRRISPLMGGRQVGNESLSVSLASLQSGGNVTYFRTLDDPSRRSAAFDSLSLYAQDHWRPVSRLTFTYGLRWELVPAVHAAEGPDPMTLENLDDPYGGQMRIASRGTSLWRTRYDNIAPRLGVSYLLSRRPNTETLVKVGVGRFYDLGYGQVASAFRSYPFTASKQELTRLPLAPDIVAPPQLIVDAPVNLTLMDRNLVLPLTYQWNVSLERSLGAHQRVTVAYVGAEGKRLLKNDRYNVSLLDWPGRPILINVNRNRGYSDYHALQLQVQRRLHSGLQAMASYTFGRARDTVSSDATVNVPAEKLPPQLDFGYADFDVRHSFIAAATYEIPSGGTTVWRRLLADTGIDLMLRTRSAFPVNPVVSVPFPPESQSVRPNVVPGESFYIDDPTAPGGRRLNRAAFTPPPASTQGDLVRGSVRGFGLSQIDLAFRRSVRINGAVRLQLKVEAFNLLNTPNFYDPANSLTAATFGLSSQMLNTGLGGLNATYQVGGPRSVQLAAKVAF